MELLHSRPRSQQRFKMSVNVCPDDIFRIAKHFVTTFGMVMQHHEPESCRLFVVAIIKIKVTARAHVMKIWLFLQYYLNCWFLGNQTWSDDTSSEARVSYDKNWILHSRSRSQWSFGMLMNVCRDDIFWTTEHFVTKFGMVMQHHEPECHAEKFCCCCLQGQGHSKGSYDQNMTLLYFLNCWFLGNQTWSDDTSS